MPSLDFIRDICKKLKSQDLDYYILAIQKSKPEARVDSFIRISEMESANALEKTITELKEKMAKSKEKFIESEKEPKKEKKEDEKNE
ncbi:MAG: hypothetical protein AABY22_28060 [Nanoarchaeota archaeon]